MAKDWTISVFISIPKIGDATGCGNYRTIAPIPHASKILLKILQRWLQPYFGKELPEKQAGFKAFDCVNHQKLWNAMKDMCVKNHLISLIRNIYIDQEATVQTEHGDMAWFKVEHGCSPHIVMIISTLPNFCTIFSSSHEAAATTHQASKGVVSSHNPYRGVLPSPSPPTDVVSLHNPYRSHLETVTSESGHNGTAGKTFTLLPVSTISAVSMAGVFEQSLNTKYKTMEGMKLAFLLCLSGQVLPRPVYEPRIQDDSISGQDRTVFEVIQAANRDVRILLKESDVAFTINRNARKCSACKWLKNANGIVPVPYTISSQYSASEVSLINEALKEFEVMTCVQFVDRNSEPDYLSIEPGSGCWSYIGKISGKQTVSLASPSCMVYGVIQHEAMHNIGFFHEHTRQDRDDYVDILWQNIDRGNYGNFDMAEGNTFNLPYDYTSVMHYHRFAFSLRDSLSTIVPKPDAYVPIGQRSGMSSLDVMKINANYGCNLCRVKLVTASGSLSGDSSSANQGGGNCLWLIQVPYMKILLQFSYLNIASTDYVTVYDGYTKSSPVLLERIVGFGPILPLVSSKRNMLVEFVSRAGSLNSKFTASYVTVATNYKN
ncbi:astacin-like metalloendopeptidase [Phyllobates terribilis]|uniref:astacin-like metalloendopeptidase n=1 Tax=Phyllobates terribilis TaxID=111132 RepID=UPI003CCA9D73